ncbi:MAG: LLM class flavin-dependent oxidoreductase [Motilibacteraceae bacterium]
MSARLIRRGLAAPCFAEDPSELVDMAVAAEAAGFDAFFLWDHILFANDGDGPAIVDPWITLAAIADRTQRILIGTMVTPVSRRRPWVLARQTATLDVLSAGRLVLGVGLGSPAEGDFGRFGEVADPVSRAELLDEGLEILEGLWSGEPFAYTGRHLRLQPVTFRPRPVQRPRIPIWVGGTLPNRRPMSRAARWDGAVPITWVDRRLARPSAAQIAEVRDQVQAERGDLTGYEIAVWAEVAEAPEALRSELADYVEAGATWWIETAKPEDGWQDQLRRRIAARP